MFEIIMSVWYHICLNLPKTGHIQVIFCWWKLISIIFAFQPYINKAILIKSNFWQVSLPKSFLWSLVHYLKIFKERGLGKKKRYLNIGKKATTSCITKFSFTEKPINWTDYMKTFKDCFYFLAIFFIQFTLSCNIKRFQVEVKKKNQLFSLFLFNTDFALFST